ncbi:amidoligase family protein [Acidithiobacillus sp. M4-SHS-6]|uniref:amidoligase family protein n=1 Tax=Acidithiobacillus sp. M4-SHS-6 TaxID=3383024 RepID=UPI0039BE2BDC
MWYEYHSSGSKKFKKAGRSHQKVLGVEIEFAPSLLAPEKFGGVGQFCAYLEKTLYKSRINPDLFVFEKDGSIPGCGHIFGLEMISRPMASKMMRQQNWAGFFRQLQSDGFIHLGHPDCGMHIHVDGMKVRETSREDSHRYFAVLWHRLATLESNDFGSLFGRYPNEYCETFPSLETEEELYDEDGPYWSTVCQYYDNITLLDVCRIFGTNSEFRDNLRYVPLNMTHKTKTLEFRMWASPQDEVDVSAAITFAEKFGYPDEDLVKRVTTPDISSLSLFL